MPNTGSSRYSAKPGIGQHRDMFAVRKSLEGRGYLISLLHACAFWAATDQNDHISVSDLPILNRLNRIHFGNEHSGRSFAISRDLHETSIPRIDSNCESASR